MNRDEVLERSRKEMKDEGMVAAENTWRKIGYFAFMIVHLFLISFNWFDNIRKPTVVAMFPISAVDRLHFGTIIVLGLRLHIA